MVEVSKDGLLPCPFCGGEASKEDIGGMKPLYSVGCDNSECRVECSVTGIHSYAPLVKAWNTRAPSTLQAERDRYRVALEPFAAACTISNLDDDECIQDRIAADKITFGHLRAARTALSDTPTVQS